MAITPFFILVCIALLLAVASLIWHHQVLTSVAVILLAVALLIRT